VDNARWYDPMTGRFTQADTLVPNNVNGLDRYMYVNNSPVRYIDPSGHDAYWCETASCSYNYYTSLNPNYFTEGELEYIKQYLEHYYGITLDDGGATNKKYKKSKSRSWDLASARQVDLAMGNINSALNEKLRKITGETKFIFTLNTHPEGGYLGWTNGQQIDFYTNTTSPLQNIYHEFGHALDSLPGKNNMFSNQIPSSATYAENGFINLNALVDANLPPEPNWPGGIDAKQAFDEPGATEVWADIFANYVAGNIDIGDPFGPGAAMNTFVTGVFAPYGAVK
jgi:hypothetical protein